MLRKKTGSNINFVKHGHFMARAGQWKDTNFLRILLLNMNKKIKHDLFLISQWEASWKVF